MLSSEVYVSDPTRSRNSREYGCADILNTVTFSDLGVKWGILQQLPKFHFQNGSPSCFNLSTARIKLLSLVKHPHNSAVYYTICNNQQMERQEIKDYIFTY